MAETLQTPAGVPVAPPGPEDTERAFAAAMATPPADPPGAAPADGPPGPPRKDPEAPYGRTKDGVPKKGPGGRPSKHDKPRVSAAATAVPLAERHARWVEGLSGFGQLGAAGAMMMHGRTGQVAWQADAVAIVSATPGLAAAAADVAAQDERIGRLFDKVIAVGPYGALLTASFGLGVQLAANHGVAQAEMLGGTKPEVLIASFEAGKPENGQVPAAA